jgi:hypothetical protein
MSSGNGDDAQIQELLSKAYALGEGEEKLALLEEATRLADAMNDVPRGMELRDSVIDAATWAGFYERALAAFNWKLAQFDRDLDAHGHEEHHLLWLYKWIMEHLHQFPQVSRAQHDAAFADMERRFTTAGHTLRAVHKLRCIAALEMGELAKAAELERLWQATADDGMGDCEACEVHSHVCYFVDLGDDAKAVATAAPLFRGRLRCTEVPNLTYSRLLLPLLKAGDVTRAAMCHRKSLRQMRESRKFISNVAEHLVYLALTGQYARAVKLFEARLPWAAETRKLHDRFEFYVTSDFLMRRLVRHGKPSLRVRLPERFPLLREDDTYDTAALADGFRELAGGIAAEFDARNGNDRYTRRVARLDDLADRPDVDPGPPAAEGGA